MQLFLPWAAARKLKKTAEPSSRKEEGSKGKTVETNGAGNAFDDYSTFSFGR